MKQIQAEVYYSVSIWGTNTNRKESSAAVPGQQMQCGISTVHRLFATRRLQQNNLMQSQQAVKEDTVTFSCQSAVTATHTGASPHHAAVHDADHQCRSEQQYMIKRHVLQVGPVLNEHPNPRTGSPSTRGTTTPSDTRSENRDCVEIDTTANTQYTHHITNGGDVSDSHLVYSVPLTAIFIK